LNSESEGKGPSRKARMKTLTIQVTEAQHKSLMQYCEKHGFTVQELFRFLILPQWIAAREREEYEAWRRRRQDEVLAALEAAAKSRNVSVGELIFSFAKGFSAEGGKADELQRRK